VRRVQLVVLPRPALSARPPPHVASAPSAAAQDVSLVAVHAIAIAEYRLPPPSLGGRLAPAPRPALSTTRICLRSQHATNPPRSNSSTTGNANSAPNAASHHDQRKPQVFILKPRGNRLHRTSTYRTNCYFNRSFPSRRFRTPPEVIHLLSSAEGDLRLHAVRIDVCTKRRSHMVNRLAMFVL